MSLSAVPTRRPPVVALSDYLPRGESLTDAEFDVRHRLLSWVLFVWNALFTTISHGFGSWLWPTGFFSHASGQHDPWEWSIIHGVAVLAACAGVLVQMRFTEQDHRRTMSMRAELLEGNRKRF